MKRLIALTTLVVGPIVGIGVAAAPAGAVIQRNVVVIHASHNFAFANTGGNVQFGGGTINTAPAITGNVGIVIISQSNTNP